jgi:toxin ParE1/3/4
MNRYILSLLAEEDLQRIWDYIADDNADAADRVLLKIQEAMRKLASMPGMGHRRSDINNPSLRFWLVYSYLIVYRVGTQPLEVARIIHGAQDIPRILEENEP